MVALDSARLRLEHRMLVGASEVQEMGDRVLRVQSAVGESVDAYLARVGARRPAGERPAMAPRDPAVRIGRAAAVAREWAAARADVAAVEVTKDGAVVAITPRRVDRRRPAPRTR